MPKYMDTDAFLKLCKNITENEYNKKTDAGSWNDVYLDVIDLIERTPGADVQEIKHGYWVNDTFCSICNRFPVDASESISNRRLTKFFEWCPHCGAKIDRNPT